MPDPITDATLYRLLYGDTGGGLELDLDVSLRPAGECRCTDADPDRRGCQVPYTFAGGRIRLSCSNGDAVCDLLADRDFRSDADLDAELLRCVEAALAREQRVAEAQAKSLDFALSILNLKGAA